MSILASDIAIRRVYGYFKGNVVQYIGSSYCSLKTLEFNHRNALTKYPNQDHTDFRKALATTDLKEGEFRTILEEYTNQEGIEALEGSLIRAFKPLYNKDYNPVRSSKIYKRY
jgi:hypothetical protein